MSCGRRKRRESPLSFFGWWPQRDTPRVDRVGVHREGNGGGGGVALEYLAKSLFLERGLTEARDATGGDVDASPRTLREKLDAAANTSPDVWDELDWPASMSSRFEHVPYPFHPGESDISLLRRPCRVAMGGRRLIACSGAKARTQHARRRRKTSAGHDAPDGGPTDPQGSGDPVSVSRPRWPSTFKAQRARRPASPARPRLRVRARGSVRQRFARRGAHHPLANRLFRRFQYPARPGGRTRRPRGRAAQLPLDHEASAGRSCGCSSGDPLEGFWLLGSRRFC